MSPITGSQNTTAAPLPHRRGALSPARQWWGLAVALLLGPPLTMSLEFVRDSEFLSTAVLAYQLLVVIVALIGGWWPAVFTALLSGLSLDYMLMPPYHTVRLQDPAHVLTVVMYVVIALVVSYVVDKAARRERVAERATAESELLSTVAGSVLRGESAPQALIARTREAFAATGARLVSPEGTIIARDGEPASEAGVDSDEVVTVPVGTHGTLELHGARLDDSGRRVLDTIVAQLDAMLERAALTAVAADAHERAAAHQVRSAILRAVSHDVRRPLAAAVASVGGLKLAGNKLSEPDREELLDTADESLATLSTLVGDLLDVSRIQAGALAVRASETDVADVVAASIAELGLGHEAVIVDLDQTVVYVDAALLRRVVVNVLANAVRHSPSGSPVQITSTHDARWGYVRIIDHGPGIPPDRREDMFAPFQRMDDTDNATGLGLGLALSLGFAEGMGGTLTPETTEGGGLTMVIQVPLAEQASTTQAQGVNA